MDYTYTNPQQQLQHQQQQLKEQQCIQQQQQQQGFQPYPNNDNISSTYLYQQPQQQVEANAFNRSTEGFPRSVLDRATAAKLRLEHYYKTALDQAFERNQR